MKQRHKYITDALDRSEYMSMDDDRHLQNQIECADKINCKEKLNKEIQETEYDSTR